MQWFDAFNAGDGNALTAFMTTRLSPELAKNYAGPGPVLQFRDSIGGGFELKKSEDATPTHFSALLKELGSDQFVRVIFEVDASHHVVQFEIQGIPTPDEFRPARLSEGDAIAALRTELDARVAKDQFSGAVLVAKNGKAIFTQAYGMADRDHNVPNTVTTRFRIGSMSKMFTATAILQLVQAKKLSLDDTVGTFLPDYPNKDLAAKVTIRHLLTHTGGTGDFFGPEYDVHRLELRTLQDYVKLYGARPLTHEPGEKFEYSNYGFILLGVIIEKVTKQSYYDHVAASVFKPAGMTATSWPFEDKPLTGRAVTYSKNLADPPLANWTDAKDKLTVRATSAGGSDSTVGDLLAFANALTANKLLDKSHTELLTSRKTGTPSDGYAFGFSRSSEGGVDCFGHNGGYFGMNGELLICSSGYTIAVLANLDPPAASRISQFIRARLPK